MKQFCRRRYEKAKQELATPGSRPKFEPTHRPGQGRSPQLARKVQRLQQGFQGMQEQMRRVGALLQQGKTREAEKLIDMLLKQIGNKPSN